MKERSVSTGYLEAEEKVSVSERPAEGQPTRGTFAIKKRTVSSSLQVSDFTQLLSSMLRNIKTNKQTNKQK